MKKNAMIPACWATWLGFEVERGKKGNALPYDTGRPVQPLSKSVVVPLLLKAGDSGVTCSQKKGAIEIKQFLKDAYKLSQRQGQLTMKDIHELSGVAQVTLTAGTPDFRKVFRKLLEADAIAPSPDIGRGEAVEKIDWSADIGDIDLDSVDIDSL